MIRPPIGLMRWTGVWVAQQLRQATPFNVAPKYLIRDNDAR
ncbi:MAG TPA: hypothetical protein VLA19_03730 [Herpetosiphonaceae bacterium]|nr:hypothetical protein [Herpetosiphonaceae bacterium]